MANFLGLNPLGSVSRSGSFCSFSHLICSSLAEIEALSEVVSWDLQVRYVIGQIPTNGVGSRRPCCCRQITTREPAMGTSRQTNRQSNLSASGLGSSLHGVGSPRFGQGGVDAHNQEFLNCILLSNVDLECSRSSGEKRV